MNDAQEWTCGKGLAANAELPAKLAQLLAARAEVLERHTHALDLSDTNGRRENDAYLSLVRGHRELAAALEKLSREMASYRDLPMSPHDMTVMQDPNGQSAAFREFVRLEEDLVAFLQSQLDVDKRYL